MPTSTPRHFRADADPSAQALDPRLLGRPVHLLPRLGALLREDLARALQAGLNRRWGADFRVGPVAIARADGSTDSGPPGARWHAFEGPSGRIGFALERGVLLAVLGYRYGASAPASGAQPDTIRETATEERLAISLGQQWVALLAARIAAGLHPLERDAVHAREWHARPGAAPEALAWMIRTVVEEPTLGVAGTLTFALDEATMARLLRALAPARSRAGRGASAPARPLAEQLQVTLTGRLVRKEMQLGDVLDLRPGAIVPVSLGVADVLVGDSLLFTAAVSEHKGKLCLTSFDDLE
jgi:flagellar motor switch protein FliM